MARIAIAVIINLTFYVVAIAFSPNIRSSSVPATLQQQSSLKKEIQEDKKNALSPYEILHPLCPLEEKAGETAAVPLVTALKIMKETLSIISNAKNELLDFLDDHTVSDSVSRVIRIEQPLSHGIDPLCWLHTQTRGGRRMDQPVLYFSNTDHSDETAVYGSAYTHYGVSNKNLWGLVSILPQGSRVYGGNRFDTDTEPSEEWSVFGNGMWLLPMVELKRMERPKMQNAAPAPSAKSDQSADSATLSVHIVCSSKDKLGWRDAAKKTLLAMDHLNHLVARSAPPTTLPPIISRESSYSNQVDGQETYEKGVAAALKAFASTANATGNHSLKKVVLARRSNLKFDSGAWVSGLDSLLRWKFGGKEGGHLFYLSPGHQHGADRIMEFFGCTPELLFRIQNGKVESEALAGTRPRGSTAEADAALAEELYRSQKDRLENEITAMFVRDQFLKARTQGLLELSENNSSSLEPMLYIRRLRHLQHICQRYSYTLNNTTAVGLASYLLERLHPTPAICGYPANEAKEFIRKMETSAFDRGFYSGPFGFLGQNEAEIVVAIRSGLLSRPVVRNKEGATLALYAGAGIVPGSAIQGEWAETSYKLAVMSSLFRQSPITLSNAVTPNVAWADAFVDELIRCGVTQFFVCPGSRSTPFVVALSKAVRSYVGLVHAVSVHDERAAGFRSLGYGRGCGRPAAVVTSSGTAVANLYPSVMEAGMDGIPMILLTADRPYESRDVGDNQAVDQVKAFSSSYIRWFRDIAPPNDDVPVSLALSDANHAARLAQELLGPVHVNVQFRENLAPDPGQIRNDGRVDSLVKFNGVRFTDVPNFYRWSRVGEPWAKSFSGGPTIATMEAVHELADIIRGSKRGIIVIGNLRMPGGDNPQDPALMDLISQFAELIGFPVIVGAQSAGLRFRSKAVLPYANHVLGHNLVAQNLNPDLIIQIGHPLISTQVSSIITSSMKSESGERQADHVLIHPHGPSERSDPGMSITHRFSTDASPFLVSFLEHFGSSSKPTSLFHSELAPIVLIGRRLASHIPALVHSVSESIAHGCLTEPQIILAISEMMMSQVGQSHSIFLSNSMPIRDAESFLYPLPTQDAAEQSRQNILVGGNRGASGIDGIISSALGFMQASKNPTTLLIGDLAALHDLNAFHSLADTLRPQQRSSLVVIVVNNDGGGIFSFLPIANHEPEVNFEEFFGTPTNSFSFKNAMTAFGLTYWEANSFQGFRDNYRQALGVGKHNVVEAKVVDRNTNVAVHREITKKANLFISDMLKGPSKKTHSPNTLMLPVKDFSAVDESSLTKGVHRKTMLLLHGWLGDKSDWKEAAQLLANRLPDWSIIAVDLVGHGETDVLFSSDLQKISKLLGVENDFQNSADDLSIDGVAKTVMNFLSRYSEIDHVDAIAGYSWGGRVAMAMMRLAGSSKAVNKIRDDTKLILLGSNPGNLPEPGINKPKPDSNTRRASQDSTLAAEIRVISDKMSLADGQSTKESLAWSRFLSKWYSAPLWGDLASRRPKLLSTIIAKRISSLTRRGNDLAAMLEFGSVGRNPSSWGAIRGDTALFVAGGLDVKYMELGSRWASMVGGPRFCPIVDAGHALLAEAPGAVAETIVNFLQRPTDPIQNKVVLPVAVSVRKEVQPSEVVKYMMKHKGVSDKRGHAERISIDFLPFKIDLVSEESEQGISGLGWGDQAGAAKPVQQRSGFVVQIVSLDRAAVGLGEVSPLKGLHKESLQDTEMELLTMRERLREKDATVPSLNAHAILSMEGGMDEYIDLVLKSLGLQPVSRSVRTGLEMAFLSLACQIVGKPILAALAGHYPTGQQPASSLVLNGLVPRSRRILRARSDRATAPTQFSSLKVKVGYQNVSDDLVSISRALQDTGVEGKYRCDANRAWDLEQAKRFADLISDIDPLAKRQLEYIEEPLKKEVEGIWSVTGQVNALEELFAYSGIKYALDESIGDLAEQCDYNFMAMREKLIEAFITANAKGCAALVLKPSILGLELSLRLARVAKQDLSVGAVFTSSFDSGVGLSYVAFLAATSDTYLSQRDENCFAHGIGTFTMLAGDTLHPSFGSYVNEFGILQVASLSRALFGLGLDELRQTLAAPPPPEKDDNAKTTLPDAKLLEYQASAARSGDTGREIRLVVSLPLPFSDETACSRFTDLPQQSRWSPWLSSVAYLEDGSESEWTLNVRGVRFSWRAVSEILDKPYLGIRWESISGLKNVGVVEFIPTNGGGECTMRVRMTIVAPLFLTSSLFPGASGMIEDFLQNKLLKWSLEMFRDVVKGDLALEQGDSALGDALFGAVEGRANATVCLLLGDGPESIAPKKNRYKPKDME